MACKVILYSTPHIQKSTGFERHDPLTLEKLRILYHFLKVQFFTDIQENLQISSFYFLEFFLLFFYVIEIKTTIFPVYPNFDFEIAKNASGPILEIFDKYYL